MVSLWSAFEVFVRDILIAVLNEKPLLSEKLLSDAGGKRYFDLPKVSIEDISLYGYNFSNKMGIILFGSRDFSDIRAIQSALNAIFDKTELHTLLEDRSLWYLNQDRHLIVHRRGIVDNRYIQSTGCKYACGSLISVPPLVMESYFAVVIRVAEALFATLDKHLNDRGRV